MPPMLPKSALENWDDDFHGILQAREGNQGEQAWMHAIECSPHNPIYCFVSNFHFCYRQYNGNMS